MIERRPRAPVLRSMALRAMAPSDHITLFASGKGRRSETVGPKLGASPGPKGPQVGPIVRFMAFTIFFPEQVHGRAPTVT